jgi:alpha/beta superfamily hydrolase
MARACTQHGLVVIRPDFRGVGQSAGTFDHARGETADMLALVAQWRGRFPQVAQALWVLGGFSFGTAVAAQLHAELADAGDSTLPAAVILVGTTAQRFLYRAPRLPADTLLVHGEDDEVVPLAETETWGAGEGLTMVRIPGASHFFHGKLIDLRERVAARLTEVLP